MSCVIGLGRGFGVSLGSNWGTSCGIVLVTV